FLNHLRETLSNPRESSLPKSISWFTVSKAFDRSINKAAQHCFLSTAEAMSFTTRVVAVTVLWPALKSDLKGHKIEFKDRKELICSFTKDSNILARHGSLEIGLCKYTWPLKIFQGILLKRKRRFKTFRTVLALLIGRKEGRKGAFHNTLRTFLKQPTEALL